MPKGTAIFTTVEIRDQTIVKVEVIRQFVFCNLLLSIIGVGTSFSQTEKDTDYIRLATIHYYSKSFSSTEQFPLGFFELIETIENDKYDIPYCNIRITDAKRVKAISDVFHKIRMKYNPDSLEYGTSTGFKAALVLSSYAGDTIYIGLKNLPDKYMYIGGVRVPFEEEFFIELSKALDKGCARRLKEKIRWSTS